jgi:hypothetical protein
LGVATAAIAASEAEAVTSGTPPTFHIGGGNPSRFPNGRQPMVTGASTQRASVLTSMARVSTNSTPFPADKLERIINSLEKQGIRVAQGVEAEDFLNEAGIAAAYDSDIKTLFLGRNPSAPEVVEELIHLGQHRKMGFKPIPDSAIPRMEIEAQEKLLKLGEKFKWTAEEQWETLENAKYWMARI